MRIRDPHFEGEEPVNLMPLIDILFFLIMFFLLATKFKEEERDIGVRLPGLVSSQPLSAAPQQLIVNIQQDGSLVVANKTYDLKGIEELFATQAKMNQRDVLIRADERSIHKYFAAVAAAARRAGVGELRVGYILQEPQPVRP